MRLPDSLYPSNEPNYLFVWKGIGFAYWGDHRGWLDKDSQDYQKEYRLAIEPLLFNVRLPRYSHKPVLLSQSWVDEV